MSDVDSSDNFAYREWDDDRIGLAYAGYCDIVYYYPHVPFYVDGICYSREGTGPMHRRTMIELLDDGGGTADMDTTDPPSEADLDCYVQTGLLGGREVD